MATMASAPVVPAALGPTELQGLAAVMSLLAQAGGIESPLRDRPAPRSTQIHIAYAEAAERLNIPEKWLREHISTLPHRKFGKFVQFTEEDLRAISDMHFVNPGAGDTNARDSAAMTLQPSRRSRKNS
ncbi:helix-turn-helix domain-containing protein [Streptomyces murinus]